MDSQAAVSVGILDVSRRTASPEERRSRAPVLTSSVPTERHLVPTEHTDDTRTMAYPGFLNKSK